MNTIILASNNQGKVRELQALLEPLNWNLTSQGELNISSIEETGTTFVENALIKARHACAMTGKPAIADDSGLCVTALGGTPGIYSSRFAGENASDQDNIDKLLIELKSHSNRQAYFYCTIVMLQSVDDPTPIIAQGKWHGEIIDTPRGDHGFGYDPVFYIPELQCTSAELEASKKNAISHRAKALHYFLNQMRNEHE